MGSFASLSMVRSTSSLSDAGNVYRTQFNAKEVLPAITKPSVDTHMDQDTLKADAHVYINHDFK